MELCLELFGEKSVVLPFFTGHVARGLLLHVVRQVDPAASGLLHELNVSKPYSVTPLWFKSISRSEKGYVLDPLHPCRVGFRFLRDRYADYVLKFFEKQSSMMILDTSFPISSIRVNSKRYEDLEKESTPVDELELTFRTPTYFSSLGSGYHWMFPDAVKVFCGLMRTWNLFSNGKRFGKDDYIAYRDWLTKNIGVSEYQLETRMIVMRQKKATGFTGWVTYELKDEESEWNKTTCVLARYAEYSNIGGNRTGGFGVVKIQGKLD